jgi:hypothetical protein
VELDRKVENRQGSPDIMRDPAIVSILIFRVRRDLRDHLAQWLSTLAAYQTHWGVF